LIRPLARNSAELRRCLIPLVAALAAPLFIGCERKGDAIAQAEKAETGAPGITQTKAIAEEAYIYGLPMIAAYKALYQLNVDKASGQYKGGFNTVHSDAQVFTYKDTAIVTPNSDTPYSMLQADLRAEPLVLGVPPIDKARYYSVQFADLYSCTYAYVGSRATGNNGGRFLLAGPGWKGDVPAGIDKVFRCETQFSLVIYRTQLFDAADIDNVKKIQAGYTVQPLSAFLKQPPPAAAPEIAWLPFNEDLFKTDFARALDFLLQFCPEVPEEAALRARFASIGIGPGKKFSFADLDLAHKAEVAVAVKEGYDKVERRKDAIGKNINGWLVGAAFGDRAFYHGDYLLRAAAAVAGIYGNIAEEAMYPMAKADAAGAPLDGSKHKYTLTFAAGDLPPVNAFWSVTMYDGKTQLLIRNPINRYLINAPMLPGMKKNPDGSLTIYIQKDTPGPDKESNWLPAPDGPIYLVMRLYWPKSEAPSILPPGEGTWKPPAIVAAP
jgi:hypothetical protein